MALTNDGACERWRDAAQPRHHPRRRRDDAGESDGPWYYQQIELGFNYRMTDIQAALGASQLRASTSSWSDAMAGERYDHALADLPVTPPCRIPRPVRPAPLRRPIEADNRVEALRSACSGMGVNVHYIPVHLQPFARLGHRGGCSRWRRLLPARPVFRCSRVWPTGTGPGDRCVERRALMNVAIIPARGGSKRIPRKNIRLFAGMPIIALFHLGCPCSGLFAKIMVTTDDAEIARIACDYGATVPFVRSSELSDDFATTDAVLLDALQWLGENGGLPEYFCCIYAAAPFVTAEYLKKGYELLRQQQATTVFPVTTFPASIFRALHLNRKARLEPLWPENALKRSQDFPEAYYDAGQFYWGIPANNSRQTAPRCRYRAVAPPAPPGPGYRHPRRSGNLQQALLCTQPSSP